MHLLEMEFKPSLIPKLQLVFQKEKRGLAVLEIFETLN